MGALRETRVVASFRDVTPDMIRRHRLHELEMAAYEAECAYVCVPDDMPAREVDRLYFDYLRARAAYRAALA